MRRFVECKVKPQQLEALYDGELAGWRANLLRAHVAICGKCQQYLRSLEQISAAFASAETLTPGADFVDEVMAAIEPASEPVLAQYADQLQAPEGVGGPEFVEAVMSRVREPAEVSAGRQMAQWWMREQRLARLGVVAAAVAMVFLIVSLMTAPTAQKAMSLINARIVQMIEAAPGPLASIRTSARQLAMLRIRRAQEAGVELEDIGWSDIESGEKPLPLAPSGARLPTSEPPPIASPNAEGAPPR